MGLSLGSPSARLALVDQHGGGDVGVAEGSAAAMALRLFEGSAVLWRANLPMSVYDRARWVPAVGYVAVTRPAGEFRRLTRVVAESEWMQPDHAWLSRRAASHQRWLEVALGLTGAPLLTSAVLNVSLGEGSSETSASSGSLPDLAPLSDVDEDGGSTTAGESIRAASGGEPIDLAGVRSESDCDRLDFQ